jgi:predicted dehydrogenase
MNRRIFLMCGGSVLAAQVPPSGQIVVGLIGAGTRGMQLLQLLLARPDVRIGAVCETYEPRMFQAVALARSKGHRTRYYRIYRDLLSDMSLDAVVIATPDFWHCRMTIEALEHGKDVYLEQPLCRTWQEGVALIAAQSGSRQIVQVGSQRRSNPEFMEIATRIHNGQLGTIKRVAARAAASYLRPGVLSRGRSKLAEPLNFEDWQDGAETRVAYSPDRFLNWRFYSMYGGGCIADLGAGLLDGVHMVAGTTYPVSVFARGTKSNRTGFDTAEQAKVEIEYPGGVVALLSIDGRATGHIDEAQIRGDGHQLTLNALLAPDATAIHMAQFFDCIRTRTVPNAPPQVVFPATLACQMANLSIATGRRHHWRPDISQVE